MTQNLKIRIGKTNTYLLQSEFGFYILIDTSVTSGSDKLINRLLRLGISAEKLKLIVITHSHYDHTGSLTKIKEWSGAKVLAHETAVPFLEKGITPKPIAPNPLLMKMITLHEAKNPSLSNIEPVKVDITVNSRYDLSEWGLKGYIIPTPGHTQCSISVIIEAQNVFVGDTLFNITPFSITPPIQADNAQLLRSWEILAESGSLFYHPEHGPTIPRQRFIKTLKNASK